MTRILTVFILACGVSLAAPVPKDAKAERAANTNAVLKAQFAKATFDASSEYGGYPISQLFDGNEKTLWYAAAGDCPQGGKKPWARVTFADAVTVSRVTVIGSRDASFPTGYFVLEGTLELLDNDGKVLVKEDLKSKGEKHDFDVELDKALDGVKAIRFTATKDEAKSNCIGLSDILVE